MSNRPPVEFQPGMEVVPGYTLITPLGSGMAGDVWQAQAAGGIKVALKVVRSLSDVGGRKELKALKTIRDVHHPNLCPLFGFWTKDSDGRILADGETEELTLDSVHSIPIDRNASTPPKPTPGGPSYPVDGTMAIGASMPASPDVSLPGAAEPTIHSEPPPQRRLTAEQLIVVMGLGDCTLFDRLRYVRQEAGIAPEDIKTCCGLEAGETIRYLRAAASAIDLLNHEHDVYHFDIKPQNILLVGGEAQVCDFGLAKKIEADVRETQQTHATPAYASPEILQGERLSTVSGEKLYVDQYSLAVTYFELRTGLLPFDVTTHASMLVAKSTGKLALEALSPPERKVLQKALQRDPKKRYRSCSDLVRALAVATGVEKSGGITIKKIVATAATLLLAVALGGFSWRYFFPESYHSVINQGDIKNAEEKLSSAEASFGQSENESFSKASVLTRVVLREASNVSATAPRVKATSGDLDLRTRAQFLYSKAARGLLNRVHETLGEVERSPSPLESSAEYADLVTSLRGFDPNAAEDKDPKSKETILNGLSTWSESEEPKLAEEFQTFQALLKSANLRFDFLSGHSPESSDVEHVRSVLRGQEGLLEDSSGIDEVLASVLVVLAGTGDDRYRSWPTEKWLEDEILADILLAEGLVGASATSEPYLSRWLDVRETFIEAVTPVVTGVERVGDLSESKLSEIRVAFPSLEADRLLTQLRQSVIDDDWSVAAEMLEELGRFKSLDAARNRVISLARRMRDYRSDPQALQELLQTIQTLEIDASRVRTLKLSGMLESHIRRVSLDHLDTLGDLNRVRAENVVRTLRELESTTEVSIGAEAFAVPVLLSLKKRPSEFVSVAGVVSPELAFSVDRLKAVSEFRPIVAAVEIERAIRKSSDVDISYHRQVLSQASAAQLNRIPKSYRAYLSACAAAMVLESVASVDEVLRGFARESVESLGDERLVAAADIMAKAAAESSGISNDDYVALRYSQSQDDGSLQAREYLRLGKFFADHLSEMSSVALDSEAFIRSVAQTPSDRLSSLAIPRGIELQLRTSEGTGLLSNQLLVAVHRVGLAKLPEIADVRRKAQFAAQYLLRPSIAIMDQVDLQLFGPSKKSSPAKTGLAFEIVKPVVTDVAIPALRFAAGDIVPTGVDPASAMDGDLIRAFCLRASSVYTDNAAAQSYRLLDEYHRHQVALSGASLSGDDLSSDQRSQLLMRIAASLLRVEEGDGNLAVRFANRAGELGVDPIEIGKLKSEAYADLAQSATNAVEKAEYFQQARQSLIDVAEQINLAESPSETQLMERYESLGNAAAFGVRQAFLYGDVEKKLPVLKASFTHINDALDLYRSSWKSKTDLARVTALVTRGNVCEDIAFYCSAGDSDEEIKRRNEFFQRSAEAFSQAKQLNRTNLKIQYSLGRALYRKSLFVDESEKKPILDEAAIAFENISESREAEKDFAELAQWRLWKMQVEKERGYNSEALALADELSQMVVDDRLKDDPRNVEFAWAVTLIYGGQGKFAEAVAALKSVRDQGNAAEFARNMGTLSDLAPLARDPEVFKFILRTVRGRSPDTPGFAESDDGSYQFAKISVRSASELAIRLAMGREAQSNNALAADLLVGAAALSDWVDPSEGGEYAVLGRILDDGQRVLKDRDVAGSIRFASELAVFLNESQKIESIIENESQRLILYTLKFWERSALDKTSGGDQQAVLIEARKKWKAQFTPRRREALKKCMQSVVDLARRGGNSKTEQSAAAVIRMLEFFD